MFHLRHIGPESASAKSICLTKTVTIIGRNSSQVDYVICSHNYKMNAIVSRRHCRLKIVDGCIQILDDSRNGIFVNDVKIDGQAIITEGDVITFGHPNGEKLKAGIRARQPSSEYQYILERCFCKQTEPVTPPMIQTDCVVTACSVSSEQKPLPEVQDSITRVPLQTNTSQTPAEGVTPDLPADTKLTSWSSSLCRKEFERGAASISESKEGVGMTANAACTVHHSLPPAVHMDGIQLTLEQNKHEEKVSRSSKCLDERTMEDFKQDSVLKQHLDNTVINRPALLPLTSECKPTSLLHSDVSSLEGKNTSTGQEKKSTASMNLDPEPAAPSTQRIAESEVRVDPLKDLNRLAFAVEGHSLQHEGRCAEVDIIQSKLIPVVAEHDLKLEKTEEDQREYVSQQDKPVLTKSQQDRQVGTQAQEEKTRVLKSQQDKTGAELQQNTSETLPQQCENMEVETQEDIPLKTGSEQNNAAGIVPRQDHNVGTIPHQDMELDSQDHPSETELQQDNSSGSDNVTRMTTKQDSTAENMPQKDNSMKTESQQRPDQIRNVGCLTETELPQVTRSVARKSAENSDMALLEYSEGKIIKLQNAVNDGFVEKKDVAQFPEDSHLVSELKASPEKAIVLENIHSEPVSVAGHQSISGKATSPIIDASCSQSNDTTNSNSFHFVSSSIPPSESKEVLIEDSVHSTEGFLHQQEPSRGNDLSCTDSLLNSASDSIHQSDKLKEEICASPENSEVQSELMQSQMKTDPSSQTDVFSPSYLDRDVNIQPDSSSNTGAVGDEGKFGQYCKKSKESDHTSEICAQSPVASNTYDSEVVSNRNGTEDELEQSHLGEQSSVVVQGHGNFLQNRNDLLDKSVSPSFHLDTDHFENSSNSNQICMTDKSKCLEKQDVKNAFEVTEECPHAVGKDDGSSHTDVSADRGNNPNMTLHSDQEQTSSVTQRQDEAPSDDSEMRHGSVSSVAITVKGSPVGLGSGSDKEVKDVVQVTDAGKVCTAEVTKSKFACNLEKTTETNAMTCCKMIDVQQSPSIQCTLSPKGESWLTSLQTPKQQMRQMKRPHTCEPPHKKLRTGYLSSHLSPLCLSPGLAHQRLSSVVPQVNYVESILNGSLKMDEVSETEEHQFSDADGTEDELRGVEKEQKDEIHQSSGSDLALKSETFDVSSSILERGQEKADPLRSSDDKSVILCLKMSRPCVLKLKDEDRHQEDQHITKPPEQQACDDSEMSPSPEEYVCPQCGQVMSVEDKENHWHANNSAVHSSDSEEDFIIIEEDEDDTRAELPYVPSGKRRKLMFDEDQSRSKDELSIYWADKLTRDPEQIKSSIQYGSETNFPQSDENKTVETPEINSEMSVKYSLKEPESLKKEKLDTEIDTSQGNASACGVTGMQTSDDTDVHRTLLTVSQSGHDPGSSVSLSQNIDDELTDRELLVNEKEGSRTDREAVVSENRHVTDKQTCLQKYQECANHSQTAPDHDAPDAEQTLADHLVSASTNQMSDIDTQVCRNDSQTAQGQADSEPNTQVWVGDMDICMTDVEKGHSDTQACLTDCDESVDDNDMETSVTNEQSCVSGTEKCQSDTQTNLKQSGPDSTVAKDVNVNTEVTNTENRAGDALGNLTDGDIEEALVGKMLPGVKVVDHSGEDLDFGDKVKVSVTKRYSRVQVKDMQEDGDIMSTQTGDNPDSIDLYLEPTQSSSVLSPNLEQCQSTQSHGPTDDGSPENMWEDELNLYVEATQAEGSDVGSEKSDINFSQMSDEVDRFKPQIQNIIHSLEGSDLDERSEYPHTVTSEHELSVIQEGDESILEMSSDDDSMNFVPNSISLSGNPQELNKPAQTGEEGPCSNDASQGVDPEFNSDTDSEVFSPLPCNQSWTSQNRHSSFDKGTDAESADTGSEVKENF